jgi:hypothetical protein
MSTDELQRSESEPKLGEPGYFRIYVEEGNLDTHIANEGVSLHGHPHGNIEKLESPQTYRRFIAVGKFHDVRYSPDATGEIIHATEEKFLEEMRRKQGEPSPSRPYVYDFTFNPQETHFMSSGGNEGRTATRLCTKEEEASLRAALAVTGEKQNVIQDTDDVTNDTTKGIRALLGRLGQWLRG